MGIAAGVFFSGKKDVPGFGDMSKLQNMRFLSILSIFLAVGIAAGVFFSGKKGRSRIFEHVQNVKSAFLTYF